MKVPDILHPSVMEMLKQLEVVLQAYDIDFYLVGAVARDLQLWTKKGPAAGRKTLDVDIAVMLATEEQFYEVKAALLRTGRFTAHDTEAIKLFFDHSIEIDLLPFGEIENEYGETHLHQPRLITLEMPGFKELHPYIESIELKESLAVNVCSLEGFVLLKLIAWDDRPARTKDITDIDHILHVYFDLNSEDIYTDHFSIMEIYETTMPDYLSLVGAHVAGRKMKQLLLKNPSLLQRVKTILGKRPVLTWAALLSGLEDE